MEKPVEDPNPAESATPAEDADPEVDLDTMSIEELEQVVETAVSRAVETAKPKGPPAPDPLEGVDPAVRELHERTAKVEAQLAERNEREKAEAAAAQENARIKEIGAVAEEFKMSRKELLAVADYADAHPEKAAVADFRTLAVMQNPELLLRAKAKPSAQPKDEAPAGGPANAAVVEVGSGGEAPPAEFKPGPGHGFGDITNWALRHQRGQFITET